MEDETMTTETETRTFDFFATPGGRALSEGEEFEIAVTNIYEDGELLEIRTTPEERQRVREAVKTRAAELLRLHPEADGIRAHEIDSSREDDIYVHRESR